MADAMPFVTYIYFDTLYMHKCNEIFKDFSFGAQVIKLRS